MSEIDDFLNSDSDIVDATMGVSTMVCDGQTFDVVWNDERKSYDGALGGLESDVSGQAFAQAADVTNPKNLLQKRCTIDGTAFRVAEVSVGAVSVVFVLTDLNNPK